MNVLLVDDEFIVVSLIKKHIDWPSIGVDEVYTAYNADEARQIVNDHAIDVIVCDIEMPQENGLKFLEWIRQHRPSITSVILTAYPDFQYAQTAIKLGVKQYLLKPVSFDELSETVRRLVADVRAASVLPAAPVDDKEHATRLFYISMLSGDVFPSHASIAKVAGESGLTPDELKPSALVYIHVPEGSTNDVYHTLKRVTEEMLPGVVVVRLLDGVYWVLRQKIDAASLNAMCERFLGRIDTLMEGGAMMYYLLHVKLSTLADCARRLRQIAREYGGGRRVFYVDDLIEAVLSAENASEEVSTWSVAEAVMHLIHQRYAEQIGRQDIEEALHMNGDYLNRVFKSVTGYSLIQYIQYYRVLAAKRLMSEENVTIAEACVRVGFDNPSYFGKVFRKWTGQTPYAFYTKTHRK